MAGVNVKMGVSGVQQFKQGIKESQAAVKTLDAELKLNEQRLKTNGASQQYMETKVKLLKEQIEKQTLVVNKSKQALEAMKKSGVNESSVAFQNMKRQVADAQTQLESMETALENVGTAGSDAATEVSGIETSLNSIKTNASWENIASGIEKITEKMEAAGRAAFNMGKKIVQATLGAGQWADDLATTATQWEMTPEQVYRMQQTANIIDTSAETIFSSRQKLLKAMGGEDDKAAMGAFAALGISDLRGTEENIEDVFWKAGEGLMKMDDKVARNEYAMKLFGKSWTDMIPIFKTGREAYEETMNSWEWMGDDQFDKLTSMNDEQMKLQTEWENFQHQFEASLAPALTEVMTILNELMHEFNTYLSSEAGQEMLKELGDAVSSLFEDLQNVKPEEVMEKLKGAIEGIQTGLQWLIDNKDSVKTAIEVIGIGFAALKLGSLAANIGQIVSGLKGFGGGGGGSSVQTLARVVPTAPTKPSYRMTRADMLDAGLGVGGVVAIGAAFAAAADRRNNHAEEVRGTEEHLAAQSAGTETLLADYIKAMQDQGKLTWESSAEEVDAAFARSEEARQKLLAEEGGKAALDAYNDWRQENSYDSDYWELPESLDRMTQVAEESTDASNKSKESSDKMRDAALRLDSMPGEMYASMVRAVRDGMAGVTIVINEGAVDTIGRQLGGKMGTNLMNYIN